MSVVSMTVGGTTDTSARFNAEITGISSVGVEIADNPEMAGAIISSTVAPNGANAGTVEETGLAANTRYWWRGRDSGVTDTSITGTFVTDPGPVGEPASFRIGLGGDAGLSPLFPGTSGAAPQRLSRHPIFTTIRNRALAERWLRFIHLGDLHYYDLGSGNHGLSALATLDQYRGAYADVLAQAVQHALYHDVPWVLVWDDHCFADNNSGSTAVGRDNACLAYRERVPSYDLPGGTGANPIYHSFQIGRTLFVVSDTRADRLSPTMLGSAQLAWLETTLTNSTADALVWLMPTPWLGNSSDTWAGFTSERSDLVQLVGDTGFLGGTYMFNADIHGAGHATAAANGHGGWPVTMCASLDANKSPSTSPQYDLDWQPGRGQYATLQVDDLGGDIVLTGTTWRGERALSWQHLTVSPN